MPQMTEILGEFTGIHRMNAGNDLCSYVAMTVYDGQTRVFLINLMRDEGWHMAYQILVNCLYQ